MSFFADGMISWSPIPIIVILYGAYLIILAVRCSLHCESLVDRTVNDTCFDMCMGVKPVVASVVAFGAVILTRF